MRLRLRDANRENQRQNPLLTQERNFGQQSEEGVEGHAHIRASARAHIGEHRRHS